MHFGMRKILVAIILLEALVSGQDTVEEATTISNNLDEDLVATTSRLPELCDQLCNTHGDIERTTETTAEDITPEDVTNNTLYPLEDTTTNSPDNNEETTTNSTNTVIEEAITPSSAPISCTTAGNVPHPSDCRRYYNCYQEPENGSLQVTEELCQAGLAFNAEFSKCMRDLEPCSPEHGGFDCNLAGSFPDPNNDTTSYYRCVPFLDGQPNSYHKYVVKCSSGMIFMPQLGKCFIDLNAIDSYPPNGLYGIEPSDDEWLVKMELKQWKIKEKTKLKAKKIRLKYEKKLQKDLAKQQAKEAKEKTKAENKLKKQETAIITDESDEFLD